MRCIRALVLVLTAITTSMVAEAQVPLPAPPTATAVQENQFRLSTTESRQSFELAVDRPGRIHVQILWAGPAQRMELTLFGPGQTLRRARKVGASPLSIEFAVAEEHLRPGAPWIVSVVNLGEPAPAAGWALTEYPSSPQRAGRLAVLASAVRATPEPPRRSPELPPALAPSGAPTSGPGLRIAADGRLEETLPDGRLRRYWIDQCGWEDVWPDGTTTRAMCVEVVRTELTGLPSGLLTNENFSDWLSELSPNLLDAVAAIVQDESEVQNYLAFEGDRPLPEKVDTRLRLLNRLLIDMSGGGQ